MDINLNLHSGYTFFFDKFISGTKNKSVITEESNNGKQITRPTKKGREIKYKKKASRISAKILLPTPVHFAQIDYSIQQVK